MLSPITVGGRTLDDIVPYFIAAASISAAEETYAPVVIVDAVTNEDDMFLFVI
jgi:hypothetical protein